MDEHHYAHLVDRARKMLAQAESDERLLAFLRESGATKIDSIKIIRTVKGCSLREADDLVHYSSVWADRRESDEAAVDSFLDSVGDVIHMDDLTKGDD